MKRWLFFEPQSMICGPRSRVFSAVKIFLEDSALRGRIALPGGEVSRKMRDTASETLALLDEEAVFSP